MTAPSAILNLVDRFEAHRDAYARGSYNETQLRREFLDPFFEALGWDVQNKQGFAEAYKDVVHEDAVKVGGFTKAPDYSFRVGGTRKFFVEAKKPSIDIKGDPGPAFQLRRYAWSAKLPVSILTDFEEFAVYDCRIRPLLTDKSSTARVLYLRYTDFASRWDDIAGVFARDAILKGSFDRFADARRRRRGTAEVDAAFLAEIQGWREMLAKHIAQGNASLTTRQLNYAVQQTIDRIIFMRICEDRGIEDYGRLQSLLNGNGTYARLGELFERADDRYNSGLFHFRREKGRDEAPDELTLGLKIEDKPLKDIIRHIYYPESPYEFSVLPADILGQVYEQFLGKIIRLTPTHRAVVEDKPEVKKAGGVYYTPTYIVDYIVQQTVGKLLDGKTPKQAASLRILDPACGSGSFLLGAYQWLLDWHLKQYVDDGPARHRKEVYQAHGGQWRLTTEERKRVLLNSIYGVDIDPQAVEVTKLSLLLKVLEGETGESLNKQYWLVHDRALPDLGANIKCGNSLVEPDFFAGRQLDLLGDERQYQINAFNWHREFAALWGGGGTGGFDVVIGNPPYVLLQEDFRDDEQLAYFRSRYVVASYKIDTYHLFVERGIRLTRPGGRCAMITPANFLANNYLIPLRRFLLTDTEIDHIVVIDGGVFRGVSVDNAVFVTSPGSDTRGSFVLAHAKTGPGGLLRVSETSLSATQVAREPNLLFAPGSSVSSARFWRKLEAQCVRLGDIADVNFGKQLRDRREYRSDVLEVAKLADVKPSYRPCYTGKDVTRWAVQWSGLACRDSRIAQRGGCWDEEKQNAVHKLLVRQVGQFPEFALDQRGFQCLNTIFMVNVRDSQYSPHFVLGVLNSRIVRAQWLSQFYDQRRTFPKIKGTYLKQLLLPRLEERDPERSGLAREIEQSSLQAVELAGKLASLHTEHEQNALTRRLAATEEQIDNLLARMFGLVDSDIAAIDGMVASVST